MSEDEWKLQAGFRGLQPRRDIRFLVRIHLWCDREAGLKPEQ
jgi:hypothetical protein